MFSFCGTKQCPKCGFISVSQYAFCPNCGTKLPVDTSPTQVECPMCRGTGKITPYAQNITWTNTEEPSDHQPD